MKKLIPLSYIYVGLFLGAVLTILIVNSYILIDRTRANLIEIYWKQGEILIKSIAISAQQSIDSVELTPQQIQQSLHNTALQIDEIEASAQLDKKEQILDLLTDEDIDSISVSNAKGELSEHFEQKDIAYLSSLKQEFIFPRIKKPGMIRLKIGQVKLTHIQNQIGLHLLIGSLQKKDIIQMVSFLDEHFRIIADADPTRIGELEEKPEYSDAIKSGSSFFSRQNEVMEIIHPLSYAKNTKGVLKISYPLTKIDEIYENTFQSTIINGSIIMVLAIIAAVIAVKLYQRNQKKLEAMEKKMRENEKLVSLSNLTAGVAHEVRNPLNSVSITIQRLQMEFTPAKNSDLEEYVSLTALMKKEVDRINRIITDFLDFAKPFEPKISHFEINEFLDDVLTLFSGEAEKKKIQVKRESETQNVRFHGDREKLTQVLQNLLYNALEATPENGRITIKSSLLKNFQWQLKISDNGRGISKENLNHIFDIYFTTKKSGTGLGLYICKKIIKAHQGIIELESDQKNGTTATITLPDLTY